MSWKNLPQKLTIEHAIAESMPQPPDSVLLFRTMAPWISYKVKTIHEAGEVFKTFADLGLVRNMEHATGVFTHLCPASDRGSRDQVVHQGDYCAAIRVHQGEGFGPAVELIFYAEVSTGLCRVNVHLDASARKLGARPEETRDRRGRLTRKGFSPNEILNGLSDAQIKFASGDHGPIEQSAQYVYMWIADDGAECTEFSHFLCQLESLAYAVDPEDRPSA